MLPNITINVFGNNTTSVNCLIDYPVISDELPDTYVSDILIMSDIGFKAGELVEIKIASISSGTFIINEDTNAFWLSNLDSVTRSPLSSKSDSSELITLDFLKDKLLRFKIIGGEEELFSISPQAVYDYGVPDGYDLLSQSDISIGDESSVSAIREAIDNTEVVVESLKNKVKFSIEYPLFGSKYPTQYLTDYLLSFNSTIPLGTEISISRNGEPQDTIKLNKNTNHIWFFRELLNEERPFTSSLQSEEWELTFVYDHEVNVQVYTGENSSFTSANAVLEENPFGLFKLADSKSLEVLLPPLSSANFTVEYEGYTKEIKKAKLNIKSGQNVFIDFIQKDENNNEFIRIRHNDEVFNVSIDLLMNIDGLRNYISLLRDLGRQMI
ncbi:hypothetical protein PQ478_08330 [Alkalihalophilus pseudofirmus]|uniref:hypothetical protein n=1 Tax=Alkalihalophilus pseudofirmus TaxID=79885 RepID=UPI00259B2C88|nr:hypothetical protein [Alkalihalophilus pseudofirmus]WEG18475.1 hypothetical protein PQ478_08330 [Alkalihalophilus pseudofirmus]